MVEGKRNLTGPKLRGARNNSGLSQEQVVEKLEVDFEIKLDQSALTRLENQKRSIDDREVEALCKIYGVEPNWVFGW